LRHEAPIVRADFLPDGRSLLTVSGERVVRVWAGVVEDLASRSLPEPVAGSKANRLAVADTPAGVRELWRNAVGEIELRTVDGVRIGEPLGRDILPVMFTKDGRGVVGQIGTTRLRAWSAETAVPLGPAIFEPAGIPWSHISADWMRWATASKGRVRVWDVATGRVVSEVVRPPLPESATLAAVHFAVDSVHLFVSWNDGLCLLWDPVAAKPVWTRQLAPHVGGIWPTTDGRAVLVHEASDRVRILSTQTGDDLAPVVQQPGSFFVADVSSTGHLMLGINESNTARAWDVRTGRRVGPPLPAVFTAGTPAISPDDRYVATSPAPQLVRVYELATGYPITPAVPTPDGVVELKFRRDGSAMTVRFGARERALLVPTDPRPAADLVRLCELLAAQHVDDTGTLAPLTPEELADRWADLTRKGTPELTDAPTDRLAWHLAHAVHALEDESWFAAAFHFRTLTALDSANPEWARRLRYAEDAEAAPELAPVPRKGR
jgi:WD40 repeat protein